MPAIALSRESAVQRDSRNRPVSNLQDQQKNLVREIMLHGNDVVGQLKEIGPGWDLDRGSRLALEAAVREAKQVNGVIVLESIARLLRHPFYDGERNNLPTVHQLQQLAVILDGVPLATVVPPEATAAEIKSYETKRGQQAKGRTGGRPPRKQPKGLADRRKRLASVALRLRERNKSWNAIAVEIGVPRSTIRDWCGDA